VSRKRERGTEGPGFDGDFGGGQRRRGRAKAVEHAFDDAAYPDDAKALVRSVRHCDRMLLIPWLVATFDSTGAERSAAYQAPASEVLVEQSRKIVQEDKLGDGAAEYQARGKASPYPRCAAVGGEPSDRIDKSSDRAR
jgi:hypothetical protein